MKLKSLIGEICLIFLSGFVFAEEFNFLINANKVDELSISNNKNNNEIFITSSNTKENLSSTINKAEIENTIVTLKEDNYSNILKEEKDNINQNTIFDEENEEEEKEFLEIQNELISKYGKPDINTEKCTIPIEESIIIPYNLKGDCINIGKYFSNSFIEKCEVNKYNKVKTL